MNMKKKNQKSKKKLWTNNYNNSNQKIDMKLMYILYLQL